MFNFWYHKENPVTRLTVILAAIVLIFSLVGAFFLGRPAISAVKNIIKNYRDGYRLIIIRPENCVNCFDIYQVSDFLKDIKGIKYSRIKEYKAGSPNAELLIKTYKIKNLPTLILQGDVEKLSLKEMMDEASIGAIDNKTFVYNNFFPPYYSLEEKKMRGEFNITYLTDKTCAKCYDVYLHDRALQNLYMKPAASSTIDMSSVEGKKAISDYKIKYVPTVIMMGDMDAYQNLKTLWQSVGTIEKDGAYIFREDGLKLMGTYKNIVTGALTTLPAK